MSKRIRISLIMIMGTTILGFLIINLSDIGKALNKDLLSTEQIVQNIGSRKVTTRKSQQKKVTTSYINRLESGKYTNDNPYIKVNPYGTSPLSALVLFQTKNASKISIEVAGKSAKTNIKSSGENAYTTQHSLSILGLYPDYKNKVTLTITDESGKSIKKILIIRTQPLPEVIKKMSLKVSKNNKMKMSIGDSQLTFLVRSTQYPIGLDADGQIRWYSTNYVQHIFKTLSNGHLIYLTKPNNSELVYNDLVETDFMGRVYQEYTFSNETRNNESSNDKEETTIIHHDAIELPNHNLLLTVSDGGGKYVEDTMVELSMKTGKIEKVIDLKRLLPVADYKNYTATKRSDGKLDWFHQNSIDYDDSDESIVISSRNQDLIMKLDYKTLKIKWIFSSKKPSKWPLKYRHLLLKLADKSSNFTGGQHAVTIWQTSKKNIKQKQLVLFNNNIAVTNGNKITSGQYSEGTSYLVDENKRTIKQNWSYGKSLGKNNFSNVIGSTRKLNNGNYLIDYGYNNNGTTSNIVEVDPKTNKPVFNLEFSQFGAKGYAYRAERFSLYDTSFNFKLE